jgi:hypothetical protein
MTRVREGGAGFCAPSGAGITRLMIATAKQNFMHILLPHCSGPVIVLLQAPVVKPDGVSASASSLLFESTERGMHLAFQALCPTDQQP